MGFNQNRLIGAALLAIALAVSAGCSGSGDSSDKAKVAAAKAKAAKAKAADDRYASAVYLAKGMPPVDLRYDLLARPAAGQPFEIELVFEPRLNGDLLEFQTTGMAGLDVAAGGAASFQSVVGHQTYVAKVLMQPTQEGVYYVSVNARLSTKVQADDVAYSIPVVVGPAPAAPEASPAATGASAAAAPAAAPAAPANTAPANKAPANKAPAKTAPANTTPVNTAPASK